MHRSILVTGAILILIGIALGAFGAHGLKEKLSAEHLNSFETGVRYQIYHGLALLIIGFNASKLSFSPALFYKLILSGVILFSGSIYILACRDLIGMHPPKIAFLITPLGGVCLIVAWSLLVVKLLKKNH
ncbi:MAG: DUF423 domain-containing protein [Crocinitomicaceae bacterium]|nr:DUF423 domain-containing protein [Crocinitomicaceae bacterium]